MESKITTKVIETEMACVKRAMANECNRDCKNCDLLMDGKDIIAGYEAVIKGMEELLYYKTLAEQGRLIELPVAIGEPIYKICYFHSIKAGFIHEEVMSGEFYAANKKYFMAGKVYRTKEEAEQALEQMKAGE